MVRQLKPLPHFCAGRAHTLTVERVGGRWYAEARHLGVLYAAGSGDTAAEALAFVRRVLDELAGREAAA